MAKSIFDVESKSFCINCGVYGHKIKTCNKPVISCGIILYYRENNDTLKYLLIRRKDTIGYIQIITGKYASDDTEYITTLLSEMTIDEKKKIESGEFEDLWDNLWLKKTGTNQQRSTEFNLSKMKFHLLLQNIKQNTLLSNKYNENNWSEPEWGFPKGRRNFKEKDINTAKREFTEETTINAKDINIMSNFPIIEEYKSTDNIEYRHIYYIAEYTGNTDIQIDFNNKNQIKEVSDIGFFTLDDSLDKIRDYHIEKKKILQKANAVIINM